MSDILVIAAAIVAGSVSVILLLSWIMPLSEKRGRVRQGDDGGDGTGIGWLGDRKGDGGGDGGGGD